MKRIFESSPDVRAPYHIVSPVFGYLSGTNQREVAYNLEDSHHDFSGPGLACFEEPLKII